MAEHTPGPWVLSEESDPLDGSGPIIVLGYGEESGAQFVEEALAVIYSDNLAHSQFVANARLIAAAPELLEALKAMLPEAHDLEGDLRPTFAECEVARAAIAKATGQ